MAEHREQDHEWAWPKRIVEVVCRAFAEFLKLPSILLACFLLLVLVTWFLDHAQFSWLEPLRATMRDHFFRSSQSTSELLATIAGSIITVTSITFSLLLLAVQQAASALTHQVYDQFLRRKINQIYFGFFVGLAVYTLIILASVDAPYNPVFGAALALILTVVALMIMILLLYTTINQMRPMVVIDSIHDRILVARERQWKGLARMRQSTATPGVSHGTIESDQHGYIVGIDIDALASAARSVGDDCEIVLNFCIGTFVAYGDILAVVRSPSWLNSEEIVRAIRQAIRIEQQRNLDSDPAFGITQLADIGWTSVSTAKSNPSPGLLVVRSLRDLLARWSADRSETTAAAEELVPVVYTDNVVSTLMNAIEVLAVVASESMQPQTMAEIVRTIAILFKRLSADDQERTEDLIRRSLSALGEHVLTAELNSALTDLVRVLEEEGRHTTASEVSAAQNDLSASVGQLNSRATRVRAKD